MTAIDAIPDLDQDALGMGIAGDDIAVGDLDHEAIAGLGPGMADHAIAHGMDRRAQARGDIHPFVQRPATGKRVDPPAKARRDPAALHRPARRGDRGLELPVHEQRL